MALQRQLLLLFFICSCILSYAEDKTVGVNGQSNIISVMPIVFTENGLGFGGSYERFVSKKEVISFYMPVTATFDVANSNRIYNYNTGNYSTGKADAMYYAMPGIKCYPGGCRRKINYAVGLSLEVGTGQKSSDLTDLHGLNVTENVQSHFIAGGLLQNSVNMNAGKNLYIGIELGLGSSLINNVGNVTQGNEFLIQGSFKAGYRF